jgi:hypothetical protein
MSLLDTASLIVTPNGYKEGKLYSVIPSDGSGDMSVVRATTATRVNSAGLVELVPYNFVLNSETTWTPYSVTITSGITDPNGGTNAYQVSGIASGNVTYFVIKQSNPMPLTPGVPITYSIYMKGSGTIGTAMERSVGGSYFFDTKVHTLTNQWQRFTHTFTPSVETLGFSIYVTNLTGTTATSVDIAFPQVVFGTSALDYQKTETRLNIPRLDYSNGTCPSLLVEPQRTNLTLYSEQINNAAWNKQGGSVTTNSTISPDGTQNADLFTENTANVDHAIFDVVSYFVAGTTYTISFYAKANGRTKVELVSANSGTCPNGRFDLVAETATAINASFNAQIESVGDGWFRCSVSRVAPNTGLDVPYYAMVESFGTITYVGDGTSGMYFWGMQSEAGSYPTSYIPTTSAAVTRNADVISKTGISSLIGQTEGTLFVDFVCNGFADFGTPLCINNGSTANSIWITTFGNGDIRGEVFGSSNVQASFTYSGGVVGQRYKLALVYKANDFAMYVNGTLVGSDSSGTLPINLSRVDFDYANASLFVKSALEINAAALWKTRLTNAQLAQLTTI